MDPKFISSAQNEHFKMLKSLLRARGIHEHGCALIAGKKIIDEILVHYRDHAQAWISSENAHIACPDAQLPQTLLSQSLFNELDQAGTKYPLLLVAVPAFEAFDPHAIGPQDRVLFLPLQNPDNMGAVIRAAAGFSVTHLVILKEGAHPFLPKSTRAAGASVYAVKFYSGPSMESLDAADLPLFVLDLHGSPLSSVAFPARCGILVGPEGPGVAPDLFAGATRITIPLNPALESLNAGMAVAICLYAASNAPQK